MNWTHAVAALPLWLSTGFVIVFSLLLSWRLVRFARRYAPYPVLKENNELVGFTYAVFGLIYGVLLAFTIIAAWERFSEAERIATEETTILSELWRDSQAFAPALRDPIHHTLKSYARSVIEEEWPEMAAHGRPHVTTTAIYNHLWQLSYTLQPEGKLQEAYLAEFLARLNELSATRRLRLLASHNELNGIMWLVLVIGALPAIGYTTLFANKHRWVQVSIVFSITLIVLLSLLVALSLQYPYTGDTGIAPDAFEELLEAFRQRALATPPS